MNEDFVRKDLYNANLQSMKDMMNLHAQKLNAVVESSLAKQETMNAEIKGEIKNLHTRIDGVIDTFGVAIDDIKEKQNQTLAKWAIAVAIIVGVIQIAVSLFFKN